MIGIYKIVNSIDNKFYVGSSVDIYKRWYQHKYMFIKNNHGNIYLQRVWNKYGEDSFVFEIVLLCEEFELLKYEQWFLDNLNPEYNMAKFAGSSMRGRIHTEETKKKISIAHKEIVVSGEHIDMLRNINIGSKRTKETKRKMSIARQGGNNYNSKLTEKDVLEIRKLYATGNYTIQNLADMYKVSRESIRLIVNNKTWKNI